MTLREDAKRSRRHAFIEVFDVAEERLHVEDLDEVGLVW